MHIDGAVLFAEITAPPMNLLGPELVRDLVSLIQRAEPDDRLKVLVFTSANPGYFISHVYVTRIAEYRTEAAKLTGEASFVAAGWFTPVCLRRGQRLGEKDPCATRVCH